MNAQLKEQAPRLGIFLDEPADVYYRRQLDEASNSGLSIIDSQSPAHYHHWIVTPDDDEASKALTFGKAFHCATLEPDVFRATYSVMPADAPRDLRYLREAKKPSDATKQSIEWWDAWERDNAGRVFLSATDYDLAVAMAASLRALRLDFGSTRITVADLIGECETEVTVRWIDEETGILCKLRADLWSEELAFAADLKSCLSAAREDFARAIARHRYHQQHATYCEGFRAAGKPLRSFIFLPVEKAPPHVPAAWHIDAASESRGWDLRQRAMRKLHRCLQTNEWPGYTGTVESIAIPAYAHYDTEETT